MQVQQISTSSGHVEEANWYEWDSHIFSLTKQASNHAYIYTSVTKGVKKLPHTINQLNQSTNTTLKVCKDNSLLSRQKEK